MSLIQRVKQSFKSLVDSFTKAAEPLYPDEKIQKEMEAEGWRFETYIAGGGLPYGVMPVILHFAYTPEGRPALNGGAKPEDEQRYLETLRAKQAQHAPKP